MSGNNRGSDLMKLLTILGAASAIISGLVTWMINYGVANGQTIKDIEYASKERARIERQVGEDVKEVKTISDEARKKAAENEKKIAEMAGDIKSTKDAVLRIEERLKK